MSMKTLRITIKNFQVFNSLFSSDYNTNAQNFRIGNAFSVEKATYQVSGSLARILLRMFKMTVHIGEMLTF